jgi:UDP-N-acetylglucosamine:LPS N-acetylglucosamine transferase
VLEPRGPLRAPTADLADRRPRLLGQVLLVAFFVELYDALRDLAPARAGRADANARSFARVERVLHLNVERPMNSWLAGHHTLGVVAGDRYDLAHFVVTVPLVIALWWFASPGSYRRLRDAFVLVNVIGFAAYLLVPLTPPRLLPGFVDIVATRHALGGWSTALSNASDQYAAMPSLHIAWALWCVAAVWQLTRNRTLRAVAAGYPLVTLVVILATGNHWFLDAVAGAATFAISIYLANRLRDRRNRWEVFPEGQDDRPRVLVMSASMGAGHDGAAREFARRLQATGHAVTVRDYLEALPLRLGYLIRWVYAAQLDHAPSSYEWHYQAMRTNRFIMGATNWFAGLARRRVLRMVRGARADVVVSTYSLSTQTLGRLRALGKLRIPLVAWVHDFSVHPANISPSIDLSLCITPAGAAETTRLGGRPAAATGPMVPDVFFPLPDNESRAALRRELGWPEDRLLVLVAAGSWGVGNVRATVERLAAADNVSPVVACGRNEKLRAELAEIPCVIALGWRTDMPRLLRACDVVVENAGGLTAMEAMASGVPVISHETIPGHGGHNAEQMQEVGATTWVTDPADLAETVVALARSARGERQAAAASGLFVADAAEVVAALAGSPDLSGALTEAGIVAPAGLSMARPDRRLWLRRRTTALLAAVACLLYAGTEGVAFATEHGLDVTSTTGPTEVSPIARVTAADLAAPGFAAAMRAAGAVAAIDIAVLRADPDSVAALAAQGVPLAGAGEGCRHWTNPEQSFDDLVSTRDAIDRATQQRVKLFVTCRRLSAADLGTALFAGERIVRPGVVEDGRSPARRLQAGSIVWIDGRQLTPADLIGEFGDLQKRAAAQGLTLAPLSSPR